MGESGCGPLSPRPSEEGSGGAQGGGLSVESAGAAGRGLVPFPASSGVDFGSQIHECEGL